MLSKHPCLCSTNCPGQTGFSLQPAAETTFKPAVSNHQASLQVQEPGLE
jgi:hypothetical protein